MFERPAWPDIGPSGVMHEGPRSEITVGPGMVQLGRRDYTRAERTWERQERRRIALNDERARIGVQAGDCVLAVERLTRRALGCGAITGGEVDDYRWRLLARFAPLPEPGITLVPQVGEVWEFDWTRPVRARGRITSWSRKSRARMVKRMVEIDWTPLAGAGRPFAMLTLTAPADSLVVFPTRDSWNAAFERLCTRYKRSWGEPLVIFWKHEYQRRGAPHLHGLTAPPLGLSDRQYGNGGLPFRQWLSITWAQCVDVPGRGRDADGRSEFDKHVAAGTGVDYAEGLRASDPKRAAVYFLGHNSAGHRDGKEYQHEPPQEWLEDGKVGRFWGRRGLKRAVQTVEMVPADYVQAVRTVRRWSRAQGRTKRVARPRVQRTGDDVGRVRYRMQTQRLVFCQQGAGWVAVNDGASFAEQLARYITMTHDDQDTGGHDELPAADERDPADADDRRASPSTGPAPTPAPAETDPGAAGGTADHRVAVAAAERPAVHRSGHDGSPVQRTAHRGRPLAAGGESSAGGAGRRSSHGRRGAADGRDPG